MTSLAKLKGKWERDPAFVAARKVLQPQYELARALIAARARRGLTQAQVAARMGTTQSAVARLESGKAPNLKTLARYAAAVGSRVAIGLVDADTPVVRGGRTLVMRVGKGETTRRGSQPEGFVVMKPAAVIPRAAVAATNASAKRTARVHG